MIEPLHTELNAVEALFEVTLDNLLALKIASSEMPHLKQQLANGGLLKYANYLDEVYLQPLLKLQRIHKQPHRIDDTEGDIIPGSTSNSTERSRLDSKKCLACYAIFIPWLRTCYEKYQAIPAVQIRIAMLQVLWADLRKLSVITHMSSYDGDFEDIFEETNQMVVEMIAIHTVAFVADYVRPSLLTCTICLLDSLQTTYALYGIPLGKRCAQRSEHLQRVVRDSLHNRSNWGNSKFEQILNLWELRNLVLPVIHPFKPPRSGKVSLDYRTSEIDPSKCSRCDGPKSESDTLICHNCAHTLEQLKPLFEGHPSDDLLQVLSQISGDAKDLVGDTPTSASTAPTQPKIQGTKSLKRKLPQKKDPKKKKETIPKEPPLPEKPPLPKEDPKKAIPEEPPAHSETVPSEEPPSKKIPKWASKKFK